MRMYNYRKFYILQKKKEVLKILLEEEIKKTSLYYDDEKRRNIKSIHLFFQSKVFHHFASSKNCGGKVLLPHSTAQFRVYMCIGISAVDDDNVDDNIEVYFFVAVKFYFLC